jgi:hypothetical protein
MVIFNSSGVLKKDVSIVSRKIIFQFNSLLSVSVVMKLVLAVVLKNTLLPIAILWNFGIENLVRNQKI